jgi:hypothetical protein
MERGLAKINTARKITVPIKPENMNDKPIILPAFSLSDFLY